MSLVARNVLFHLTEHAEMGKLVAPVRWESIRDHKACQRDPDQTMSRDCKKRTIEKRSEAISPDIKATNNPPTQSTPLSAPSRASSVDTASEKLGSVMARPVHDASKQETTPLQDNFPARDNSRRARAVPVYSMTRAVHFGGLGLGLAAGAAAAAMRRAVQGSDAGSSSLLASEANVERLAHTLCRLRGAALKVGQMLSFNDADVLPPALRVAMERVRDGADWMPPKQLEATMREELGDDWRTRVSSFEENPVASASIGQVHRAVLEDGRQVAIKVQYPGA